MITLNLFLLACFGCSHVSTIELHLKGHGQGERNENREFVKIMNW